jgi:hypothetical protein
VPHPTAPPRAPIYICIINSKYIPKQSELVGTDSGEAVLLVHCRKRIHKYDPDQFFPSQNVKILSDMSWLSDPNAAICANLQVFKAGFFLELHSSGI